MLDSKTARRSYEKNHGYLMSFLELLEKKEIHKLEIKDKLKYSAFEVSTTRGNVTVIDAHIYP